MDIAVSVKNLKVYYHTSKGIVKAVDDVSFDLFKGETLGLVGESGCGKTTIGMSLLRMPTPPGRYEGGEILMDRENIIPMPENKIRRHIRWEKISMVFQGAMNCLTPVYTVGRYMMETLQEHLRMDQEEAEETILKYLDLVGLSAKVKDRYPHELSGGMKQRVVIATALFLKPQVVILDEPTTALDVIVQAQILNLLKELKRDFNLSFIFITHDLATEAEIADRLLIMYAGKAAEIGTNEQVYGPGGPAHPYSEKLLASIPRLHEKADSLSFIPGAPPNLLDPPTGCRFHPRCRVVMDRCLKEEPYLAEIESGHSVACWRFCS
ncbi:MAG: ABC transporter ATP-binding protein [Syntrophobacteraceae bacterium]